MERRNVAVLAAQVANYGDLLARDGGGTVRAYMGHLSALRPIIGLNAGRMVKSTGDGFLVEFPSAIDSVACAIGIQRCISDRNDGQAASRQFQLQVGVARRVRQLRERTPQVTVARLVDMYRVSMAAPEATVGNQLARLRIAGQPE